LSAIIIGISSVLFFMTFSNQWYFTWLWEQYLKWKFEERIEWMSNTFDWVISEENKVWKVLDRFKLTDKIIDLKDNITDKTLIKTDEIVNKAFNGWINEMKDIKIFWKSLKEEVKSIISNFILDIRIFLITNIVWFLVIYLLLFYRWRVDIIKNMFSIIVIMFLVMLFSLIFYIIGQDWVINIATNNFMRYSYPILII